MAETYQLAVGFTHFDLKGLKDLKKAQKAWLKVRNKCRDLVCLKRAYENRISELITEVGIDY